MTPDVSYFSGTEYGFLECMLVAEYFSHGDLAGKHFFSIANLTRLKAGHICPFGTQM